MNRSTIILSYSTDDSNRVDYAIWSINSFTNDVVLILSMSMSNLWPRIHQPVLVLDQIWDFQMLINRKSEKLMI